MLHDGVAAGRMMPNESDRIGVSDPVLLLDDGPVAGVILAGGRGRRVGGSKPLLTLGNRPLVEHVIARVRSQVSELWLSANGNGSSLARFGLPILEDEAQSAGNGPLAGIVAGLEHAKRQGFAAIATFPCDTPFLPGDLVIALAEAVTKSGAPGAVAATAGGTHPTCALWSLCSLDRLKAALTAGRLRLRDLCAELEVVRVGGARAPFPDGAFLNINTRADIEAASNATRVA